MEFFLAHLWIFHLAVSVVGVMLVLQRRTDPAAMLSWILAIFFMPILGIFLYFLISPGRVRGRLTRRRRRVAHLIAEIDRDALARIGQSAPLARSVAPELATIEALGEQMVHMPATGGNQIDFYSEAEANYSALETAIRTARHHIHMQYYIWQGDETGRHFRDLLIEKAREGVRCRVLLDAVGCFMLGKRFTQPMVDAGVEVAFFMPLYRFRKRWSPHLRNHRKIAVIDGYTAFTGSQNIGDEYRGRLKRLSPWYDSQIRVRGPATLLLQQIFCEDWAFATEQMLLGDEYFPTCTIAGDSMVQILPSGPDQDVSVLGQIMFAAVATARESIRIATPYFVPYPALRMALQHARYRGVRVQIVVPSRTDSRLVLWACRSYYPEMLKSGIELYEFDHGMLHSKMLTVDDQFCMLGSANMDVRSFRLNFEVTALLYDERVTRQVVACIEKHLAESRAIEPKDVFGSPWSRQVTEGAARLFAPLL
ncbi:MAG: cardiolipin synthase [Phycisphaerae bacterium]